MLGFLSTDYTDDADFGGALLGFLEPPRRQERQGFWKGMARFFLSTDYTDDADFGGALLGFV